MNFKQVKILFIEKYPNGSIYKEKTYNLKNVFNVFYNTNGKVYTYRVKDLNGLLLKLKLKEATPIIESTINIKEFNKNDFGLKI